MKDNLKNLIPLFLLPLIFIFGCENTPEGDEKILSVEELEKVADQFKEAAIKNRRFNHADLQPLIQKHSDAFELEIIGESVEGRSLTSLDWGQGTTKVLLWSQMHGNESTATMSLFDLFNFLKASGDEFDELRETLRQNLSLRFIPLINPDGAERFQRRNALDIDLNRDAISQISPEAIILKNARDDFEPHFGFNLHDQQVYYNVGDTPKQATISVLAPAYNEEREVNEVRMRAMQAIVGMNRILQQVIPGQVGQYNDSFEPRAFGDNIQKWGTSTILIESGGYLGDPDKQYIRKINFMIILNALYQMATEGYTSYTEKEYFDIPDNRVKLVDLLIHELQIPVNDQLYPIDLAIRRREVTVGQSYFVNGSVDDVGDMQVYFGMEEFDATGHQLVEGQIYPKEFQSVSELNQAEALEILKQGFIAVRVKEFEESELHNLPIQVLGEAEDSKTGWQLGENPNFFISKNDELTHAVVNGYLIDLNESLDQKLMQKVY